MDPEALLVKLDEAGVVDDDGEFVSLTETFEETLETYTQFVARSSREQVIEQIAERFDDLPDAAELLEATADHDDDTLARYLAVRVETDLDDEAAMMAAEIVGQMVDPPESKCGKCGFVAPATGDAWEHVEDPSLGTLTRCPECGSTDVRYMQSTSA